MTRLPSTLPEMASEFNFHRYPQATMTSIPSDNQLLASMDLSLCCCRLVDPSLMPSQHLDDCVLQFFDSSLPVPTLEDLNYASSGNSSPSEDHGKERRRKHRESMARLRQTWRTSIASLQREERQLQYQLRRSLDSSSSNEEPPVHPLEVLRQSYCQLVQEQLRLRQERANLEAAQAHREKYERLLERELERSRIFRAISDEAPDKS